MLNKIVAKEYYQINIWISRNTNLYKKANNFEKGYLIISY